MKLSINVDDETGRVTVKADPLLVLMAMGLLNPAVMEEEPNQEELDRSDREAGILTDDEAETVINNYVRGDWSATRMGY
jgi:hypothetical protein|tara:strand:- start:253 stop:489 length:237 start_codon:yes stop_codon:yes gene_type:complete